MQEPFAEYSLEIPALGLVTVVDPEGEPGYRVRLPDGQVTAYPAASGEPCEENAAADIAAALADLTPRKAALRERTKQRRREVEEGGIVVAGVPIATDRESQAMLHGACFTAAKVPGFTTPWKGDDGVFRDVGVTELEATALAVALHVQACFVRERELCTAITNAETAEELDGIAAEIETFVLPS